MAFHYVMTESGRKLHESDKYLKLLVGPFGSGKSCACAVDVLAYACAQPPAPDGVRYSRVGIIRSTFPELLSTTRKSLLEVFPSECGSITSSSNPPPYGVYIIPLADGTTVNCELRLHAARTADDCERLRSNNWTFAWINEATGVDPVVLETVTNRVGRFPSQDMGGIRWGGVIMDFNQPEQGSWLDLYMKDLPSNAVLIQQPPAAFMSEDDKGKKIYTVNPKAENLRNLGAWEEGDPDPDTLNEQELADYLQMKGERYYRNQIDVLLKTGRDDKVQNLFCMLDVPIVDGKPVYPGFSKLKHVAPNVIDPIPFHDVTIGMDQSGIHPAAVILQEQRGKWCVLDELYAKDEGFENFLYGMLIPLLRSRYSTNPVFAAIDPSNTRDSWQAITPLARLKEAGIHGTDKLTNSPRVRIQLVEHMLNLDIGGLQISPACDLLIRGFVSEYRYRRLRATGTGGAAYTPAPEKNDYSHVHDALQYAAVLIQRGIMSEKASEDTFVQDAQRKRNLIRQVV